MRHLPTSASLVVFLLVLGLCVPLHSQEYLQISEFLALNDRGLDDEDRDEEDWIEIHNVGAGMVSLQGWYLTDTSKDLTKWQFPPVKLEPDGYLVVFASGKDRRDPAGVLHTNFKLSGAGEYLGLVRPDGVTVASEYAPAFAIQASDVSYGLSGTATQKALLEPGAPVRALVPRDGSLEPPAESAALRPWTLDDFDDSDWPSGTSGVGFGYSRDIGLDVSAMCNVNQTVYVRIPFVVNDPSEILGLTLRIRFDDGMIAYINGHEVARDNAPAPTTETWDSGATDNWPTARLAPPKDFSIRRFDFLHVGTNVLAVQGLNNGLDSPDLMVAPELWATVASETPLLRYFPIPTPGRANGAGVEALGPIIADVNHAPSVPTQRNDLTITARIAPSFDPVASVQLRYRVMFDAEVTVPMLDDGVSGDGAAGDDVYGAKIPLSAFRAGQMVRWYLTAADTTGRDARFPTFLDPLNAPQYDGTVVKDPSLTNPLPVLHWFIQTPTAADSDAGSRCSIFYDGELYDNVWINLHGQSSRGFPKKSYDLKFNSGHHFRWDPNQPRAGDINLLTTYPDKAQMRNILAYETYRDAGCAYHWVFAVRVQQNGAFWGTAHAVENGDKDWLIRMGRSVDGALYKMYNTFTSASHATSSAEKKTRKSEDNADLLAMFDGISLSGEARRQYLYDNVDVAEVVNFLAAQTLTGNTDCCHKNYYFYRDTGGSDEWQMWPWDVDLSFGRVWSSGVTYWDQHLHTETPLFVGSNNRMPQAIFETPELRQMYLRRVRTLMDELLNPSPMGGQPKPSPTPSPSPRPRDAEQVRSVPVRAFEEVRGGTPVLPTSDFALPTSQETPYGVTTNAAQPGTTLEAQSPAAGPYYEPRIDELAVQIAPDAALDNAKWNSHAWGNGSTAPSFPQLYAEAVAELRDSYLPERRRQLFNGLASGASQIPGSQPAGVIVLITAVEASPSSGNLDEQYIQLRNPNTIAVDVSGWILSTDGNTQTPIFTFRGGTVIPAGGTLYVAASRPAFRARRLSPTGGQALFVVGDYTGRLRARGMTLALTDRQGVTVAVISR